VASTYAALVRMGAMSGTSARSASHASCCICSASQKRGRKAGLQIVLATFPNSKVAPELLEHCDYQRKVEWPA
jgi:hypothetical protein